MEYKYYTISESSALALYFILLASKHSANQITITHSALKKYFGVDRVYEARLKKFYSDMDTYFEGFNTKSYGYSGVNMVLYLKREKVVSDKPVQVTDTKNSKSLESLLKSIEMSKNRINMNIEVIPDFDEVLKLLGAAKLKLSLELAST